MGSRQHEPSIPLNLDAFAADFAAFHARFAHLFARSEPRDKAVKYVRSLMGPVERRNGWQLAETMGDQTPDAIQRLLYHAKWDARQACDLLEDFIVEEFGDPEAIGVLDETGFIKKGNRSVGVARQYSGTAGKIENCQIGVFLAYATERGHVLLDRRLYLPKAWCIDEERRSRAYVPPWVQFETKPELGLWMLQHAWHCGVPMAWVTGDETYGDDPKLRAAIDAEGKLYVLAVACSTPVWTTRPNVESPGTRSRPRGSRPRVHARLARGEPKPSTVAQVIAALPAKRWRRLATHQGEKGPIDYDWAYTRVVESRDRLPAGEVWLLARRSLSDPSKIAYYLSNAGEATSIEMLLRVASTRYTIEQCFEEAKDDLGLDQYEVRTWQSWHRHITLSMMALAWLASVRAKICDMTSALAHDSGADRLEAGIRAEESRAPRKRGAVMDHNVLRRGLRRRGVSLKSAA